MEERDKKLTKSEKQTTAAFKLISLENEALKKSLIKTQNALEKMREAKFQQEKDNAILEHKQKTIFWIEFFKFISSIGIGFSINYFILGNYQIALSVGITSVLIFSITIIFTNK